MLKGAPYPGKRIQTKLTATDKRPRILVASGDERLRNLRREMLEREGYDVVASRNKQHALALLHTDRFDLLVLGDSVTPKTKTEFADLYRGHNPQGRILSLSRFADPEGLADVVLYTPVKPEDMVEAVRRLLSPKA